MSLFSTEVWVPTILFGGIFTTIIMVVYYRNRKAERTALIAAGRDANIFEKQRKKGSQISSLKYGLFLVGIAIGLVLGDVLSKTTPMNEIAAYFSMVFIFGGISLVAFYFLAKKLEPNDD